MTNPAGRANLHLVARRTVHNPKTRETIEFVDTAEETGGELFRMSYEMAPHGRIADEHDHPNQEMRIEVISGVLTCTVDGVDQVLRPGDAVTIPPGVAHFQRNDSDEPCRSIEEYRPALQMQQFFEVLAGWANDGKTNEFGLPGPMRLATLLHYFEESIRSSTRSRHTWARLLAPATTLLGYRRELESYIRNR